MERETDSKSPQDALEARGLALKVTGVEAEKQRDGAYQVVIHTDRGDARAILSLCEGHSGAVLLVGGANGGLEGGGGIYGELADRLTKRGITSLRCDYRAPGNFEECVLDVLAGLSFLESLGGDAVLLIGQSFGGAIVIKSASRSKTVAAVATLGSQSEDTEDVDLISPRPLLLVHGAADDVLPSVLNSEDIFARAHEPKRLVILPGGHSLHECRDEVIELLEAFAVTTVGPLA